MAEPELIGTNCDGETCSIKLGYDITNPNQRLGVVKRDERTIECNDDEGNDTPGLRVKRCTPGVDVPYAARGTQVPNRSNLLRVQNGPTNDPDNADDCGLVVMAPHVVAFPGGDRQPISQVVNAISTPNVSVPLPNPDSLPRLYTVTSNLNTIIGLGANAGDPKELQIAYRSRLTGSGTPEFVSPNGGFGADVRERLTSMTYDAGVYTGQTLAQMMEAIDIIVVPPGSDWVLEFVTRTIRANDVITTGAQRGFVAEGIVVRYEQSHGA